MKQKLLKSLRLRACMLVALLCAGVSAAWGESGSIEINTTNSGVTGSYQDKEFDVNDITFKFTQWMKNTNIQAKKSTTNSCYNIDAIPGTITSIVVVQTGTARAITIYGGTSEKPTAQITSPATAATMTFDFTGKNYNYFSLTTPGNACYFDKITINYTTGGSATGPSIEAGNVDIDYDATSGSIAYTIKNPTSETLSATTTSDWLTLGTVGASPIPFTCSANTTNAARTAVVTLTYGTATKNVKVTQAANPNVVDKISDITAAGTYAVQGTIVAKSQRGFIVGDGTGYVYYYNQDYTQSDYNIGDKVKLSGSVVVYGGVFEFNNTATVTAVKESNYVAEEPTVLTGAQMDSRVASTTPTQLSNYVQFEGTLSVSGTHYNITNIDGATTAVGSISYPLNTDFTSLADKTVKVTGYFVGISSSTYYNTMLGSIEEVVDATPIIDANDVTLAYDATSGEIPYKVNNPVDGQSLTATTTAEWISNIQVGEGSVTFTTTQNDGTANREATITLAYEGAESVKVTVTQRYHVADYATLPFEFNGGRGDITTTAGLTQSGLGDDYKNAPKLKFDHAGDELVLKFNERPGKLSFDVKGNPGGDPSVWNAVFKVQTSTDGTNYTDLASYNDLESSTTTKEINTLDADVRYIKWVYTEKVSGNVALGNIKLEKYVAPQNFTLTIPETDNVTITAAYGEDQMLKEGQNAEIEQNTEIILTVDAAEGYDLKSLTVTGPDGQSFAPQAVADTEGAYMFTMPAYNATVNATVEEHVEPTGATYVLATAITSGKHYVIASGTTSGDVKVMGNQNTNNRAAEDATIGDDGKLNVSDDQYEFVIESATIDEKSGYSIFDAGENGGYLYAASSSSNHLKTQSENSANGVWAITIDSEGKASVVAQGTNTRNVMQYNSSSNLFSCYGTASQSPVYLFEKVEDTPQPETIEVTISAAGYSTLYYGTKNLTVPTDMEAYTVKVTTKVERSTTYNAGDVIPAGTGVVLKAAQGTYEFTEAAEAPAKDEANMLRGSDVKATTTGGTYYYALTLDKNKQNPGFYWMVENGGAYKAGAHKAYLALDETFANLAEGSAKGFLALPGDETDGIGQIEFGQTGNAGIYNLNGQKVNKAQKGIYIVNGKKVVIR